MSCVSLIALGVGGVALGVSAVTIGSILYGCVHENVLVRCACCGIVGMTAIGISMGVILKQSHDQRLKIIAEAIAKHS
jgi:hypothetical protein